MKYLRLDAGDRRGSARHGDGRLAALGECAQRLYVAPRDHVVHHLGALDGGRVAQLRDGDTCQPPHLRLCKCLLYSGLCIALGRSDGGSRISLGPADGCLGAGVGCQELCRSLSLSRSEERRVGKECRL